MRTNSEYETIECINIPKVLFTNKKYESLSNDAKLLYSLLLDRRTYSEINDWVDENGVPYVIYPKTEMMKHLNASKYRVNLALTELAAYGDMVVVTLPTPGNACQIYVKDITADLEQVEKNEEVDFEENNQESEEENIEEENNQSENNQCRLSKFQRFFSFFKQGKHFKDISAGLAMDDEEDLEIDDELIDSIFDDLDEETEMFDISEEALINEAMADRGYLRDDRLCEYAIKCDADSLGFHIALELGTTIKRQVR